MPSRSILSLTNYPATESAAGLAVWVLQKAIAVYNETHAPATVTVITPNSASAVPGQASQSSNPPQSNTSQDDVAARREALRTRKAIQRLQNWSKNKETDLAAKVKHDAKGTTLTADQISARVAVEFHDAIKKQIEEFAFLIEDKAPFQPGYEDEIFPVNSQYRRKSVIDLGRAVIALFPSLASANASPNHQAAVRTFLVAISTADEADWSVVVEIIGKNPDVQHATNLIMGQLYEISVKKRGQGRGLSYKQRCDNLYEAARAVNCDDDDDNDDDDSEDGGVGGGGDGEVDDGEGDENGEGDVDDEDEDEGDSDDA